MKALDQIYDSIADIIRLNLLRILLLVSMGYPGDSMMGLTGFMLFTMRTEGSLSGLPGF